MVTHRNSESSGRQALLELKKLVDEATKTTHAAELESFHVAVSHGQNTEVRRTLQNVVERLKCPDFDAVLSRVRKKNWRLRLQSRPMGAG
jgi:hypothetical protein